MKGIRICRSAHSHYWNYKNGKGKTVNTSKLTKSERLAIIRFCINKGTHIKYSTHSLLRPLEMKFLEEAFQEEEAKYEEEAERINQTLIDYRSGNPLSESLRSHLKKLYGKKSDRKRSGKVLQARAGQYTQNPQIIRCFGGL